MNSPAPFQAFYETELRPHLELLEAKRRQIASRLTGVGLTVGALSLVVALVIAGRAPNPLLGLIAPAVGAMIFLVAYSLMTRGFVAEFKGAIISRIVKYIDPNLTYESQGLIPRSEYMASLLFPTTPDRYQGEDLVRGQVGKTAIQFSELHTEYKTTTRDSKGRTQTHWHTIFKGLFFIADFNKHFSGQTVVLPDTAEKVFGRFGQMLQSLNITRPGKLVQLEDVEFENRFVVYSTDQVEARYILSPALMARITAFRDRTGQEVHLSFVSSCIHVAIPTGKNLFEPKLFSSLLQATLAEEYLEDLQLAVGIVEDLNLNTRIWTKQ